MQQPLYRRIPGIGGTLGHLSSEIYREVAYIAYHFNWSRNEIMQMPHGERRKWIEEIANINKQINSNAEKQYRKQDK